MRSDIYPAAKLASDVAEQGRMVLARRPREDDYSDIAMMLLVAINLDGAEGPLLACGRATCLGRLSLSVQ